MTKNITVNTVICDKTFLYRHTKYIVISRSPSGYAANATQKSSSALVHRGGRLLLRCYRQFFITCQCVEATRGSNTLVTWCVRPTPGLHIPWVNAQRTEELFSRRSEEGYFKRGHKGDLFSLTHLVFAVL